jgi:hypothetical protein
MLAPKVQGSKSFSLEFKFQLAPEISGRIRHRLRSAGLKPAVSPICNRQCADQPMIVELFAPRGLQIRDTADCKSALREQCADVPETS